MSRNVSLQADHSLLFITAKSSSGKNLIFLGTMVVTVALQLRGLQREDAAGFAVCWLCRVCRLEGAPAPDVGKQRPQTGAVHLSQSSRLAQPSGTHE